jgi:DNA-binding NarL/FixJ family response regulator
MTLDRNAPNASASIRVMFVDDEALTRVGFRTLLGAYAPRIAVVAEARSASDALSLLNAQDVDILLTDLRMQGNSHSGLELVASLCQQHPDLPVIVVTGHNDDATVLRVFKAGASGFVSKEGEPGEVLRAIESVHGGATYFPRNLQRLLDDDRRKPALSRREQEVCDLIAIDMSSKEIARVLGIDYRTVDTHRGNIVTKLDKSGMELHRHCIDDLNARFPALVRRDAKGKLIAILAHHGISRDLIGTRLGLSGDDVAALLKS